jgi:hypothetical protein
MFYEAGSQNPRLLPTQKTIWVVGFPGLLENLFSHGKHLKQLLVCQKSNLMQLKCSIYGFIDMDQTCKFLPGDKD